LISQPLQAKMEGGGAGFEPATSRFTDDNPHSSAFAGKG